LPKAPSPQQIRPPTGFETKTFAGAASNYQLRIHTQAAGFDNIKIRSGVLLDAAATPAPAASKKIIGNAWKCVE